MNLVPFRKTNSVFNLSYSLCLAENIKQKILGLWKGFSEGIYILHLYFDK